MGFIQNRLKSSAVVCCCRSDAVLVTVAKSLAMSGLGMSAVEAEFPLARANQRFAPTPKFFQKRLPPPILMTPPLPSVWLVATVPVSLKSLNVAWLVN